MNEGDVGFHFEASDGESWLATPENASIFLFAGELAIHDHVFIVQEDEPEDHRQIGTYIFLVTQAEDEVEAIKGYMLNNGYPAHINMREVPECDRDAYHHMIDQRVEREAEELDDFLPEEWQ